MAYSVASQPVAASRPMAEKIQPMALSGRWATITAPTTMNPVKARNRVTVPGPRPRAVTSRVTAVPQPTTKIASMDQATQAAARSFTWPRATSSHRQLRRL